jgi:hypothetical protein
MNELQTHNGIFIFLAGAAVRVRPWFRAGGLVSVWLGSGLRAILVIADEASGREKEEGSVDGRTMKTKSSRDAATMDGRRV